MLLNSKQVKNIHNAFTMVMSASDVKKGQSIIRELRQQHQYPLLLADYLSKENDNVGEQSRLLAVLQLKKIENLDRYEENIWWHLNQQYYTASTRISSHLYDICLRNSSSYRIMLTYNWSNSSFTSILRLVNLLKEIVKKKKSEQLGSIIIQNVSHALQQASSDENKQIIDMFLICLYIYYNSNQNQSQNNLISQIQKYYDLAGNIGHIIISRLLKRPFNDQDYYLALKKSFESSNFQEQILEILNDLYNTKIFYYHIFQIYYQYIEDSIDQLPNKSDILDEYLPLEGKLSNLLHRVIEFNEKALEGLIIKEEQFENFKEKLILFVGFSFIPKWISFQELTKIAFRCLEQFISLPQSYQTQTRVKNNRKISLYLIGIINFLNRYYQSINHRTLVDICGALSILAAKYTSMSELLYDFIDEMFPYLYEHCWKEQYFTNFVVNYLRQLQGNGFGVTLLSYAPILQHFNQLSLSNYKSEVYGMLLNLFSLFNQSESFQLQILTHFFTAIIQIIKDSHLPKHIINLVFKIDKMIFDKKLFTTQSGKIHAWCLRNIKNTDNKQNLCISNYQNEFKEENWKSFSFNQLVFYIETFIQLSHTQNKNIPRNCDFILMIISKMNQRIQKQIKHTETYQKLINLKNKFIQKI